MSLLPSRAIKWVIRGCSSRYALVIFLTFAFSMEFFWAPLTDVRGDEKNGRARSATLIASAYAGDDARRHVEEQLREEQKRQFERQAEEQQQQAERQAEEQRQQSERLVEQQTERQREGEGERSNPSTEADEGGNSRDTQHHDDARGNDATGHSHRNHDGDDDDRPPRTLLEVWQRLTEGKKGKPRAHAPVALPMPDANSFSHHEIVATNLGRISRDRVKRLGFEIVSSADLSNFKMHVDRLRLPKGMDVDTASRLLKSELPAGAFSPNHIYRIYRSAEGAREDGVDVARMPGCGEGRCFGPSLIHWNSNLATCARRVRVGVIDTSFDLTHPALVGHKFNSGTFVGAVSPLHDWHGTAVLSILAGDARSSTPGLIPDAEFYLASVFKSDEHGDVQTSTVDLLNALAWLDAFDVRLVNMSFSGPADELLEAALARMHEKGVVFVAAAGNDGPGAPPSYPAAYPSVIAVTAVSKSLQGYRYANHGSYVDIAAPGVDIWTAQPDAKQGFRSGTSFAAPFVTSIIAAMQQAGDLPNDKAALLKRLTFMDLGEPGRDPVYGEGLPLSPGTCATSPNIATRSPRPKPIPTPASGAFSWAAKVMSD